MHEQQKDKGEMPDEKKHTVTVDLARFKMRDKIAWSREIKCYQESGDETPLFSLLAKYIQAWDFAVGAPTEVESYLDLDPEEFSEVLAQFTVALQARFQQRK